MAKPKISNGEATITEDGAEVKTAPPSQPLDPVDEWRQERATLEAQLADVASQKLAAEKRERSLMAQVDFLTDQIEKESPTDAPMTAIQIYLQRQNEVRAQRADRTSSLIAAGVSPDELVSNLSPIDQAFAQKRGWGTQRPSFNG